MELGQMTEQRLAATLEAFRDIVPDPRADLPWLRRLTFDDQTCLPELLLLAEFDDQVVGLCLGCQRDDAGVIKLIGVRPEYRGQRVASRMLERFEQACRGLGLGNVIVGAVPPNYYLPGVPLDETALVSLLLRRRYETDRQARVDMTVDLCSADLAYETVQERLVEEGISVRRASGEQICQAGDLALASFSPAWQWEVEQASHYAPVPLFVALDGERVISFAVYDTIGYARFGPTGTLPEYRRRGIGGCLMRMCLADMKERGDTLAQIAWVGPVGYYARAVGAQISRAFWVFHKDLDQTH